MAKIGCIQQGDEIKLLRRPYPHLTIKYLNRLLLLVASQKEVEWALACDVLAQAFKKSLNSQLVKIRK